MKKSKKISLIASLLYIAVTAVLVALIKPTSGILTSHGMPVIVGIIAICSFISPIAAYILIPIIEKNEEKEGKEDGNA